MGSKPCGGDLQIEIFRETRIVAQALLAISDFRHAFSRTAGAWLQSPSRELSSLHLLLRFALMVRRLSVI